MSLTLIFVSTLQIFSIVDIIKFRGYEVNSFLLSTFLFAYLYSDDKMDVKFAKMEKLRLEDKQELELKMEKMELKIELKMEKIEKIRLEEKKQTEARTDKMFVLTTFVSVISAIAAALGVVITLNKP